MSVLTLTHGSVSQGFTDPLYVKGFNRFDAEEYWPGAQQVGPDSSVYSLVDGFRRKISFDTGVIYDKTLLVFLFQWFACTLYGETRSATWLGETIQLFPENPKRFQLYILNDNVAGRGYQFVGYEVTINTEVPVSYTTP